MVFASCSSASYLLPLDNDQSVAFYKNENRHFPTALAPSAGGMPPPPGRSSISGSTSSMSTTDMLTAAYHHEMQQQHRAHGGDGDAASGGSLTTGDCPFGRVQSPARSHYQQYQQLPTNNSVRRPGDILMCRDFRPVGYLNGSSNGYYGYVPALVRLAREGGGAGVPQGNNNHPLRSAVFASNGRSPATEVDNRPSVNGHLSSTHFHGNGEHHQHIDGSNDSEQNNNNGGIGTFHVTPFPKSPLERKRKDDNLQPDDEEMDTTVHNSVAIGYQQPKRQKMCDTAEQTGMAFTSVPMNAPFPGNSTEAAAPYQLHASEPAVDEMECQDQQPQPAVASHHHLPGANGFNGPDVPHPSAMAGQATGKIQWRDDFSSTVEHHPTTKEHPSEHLYPICLVRRSPTDECGRAGHFYEQDLFHSLHGSGGGFH